jgi:hypothetical protein
MARTLDQVLAELSPQFDPQINSVRQRQAEIPGMIQAEEAGLGAKQEQAFGNILGGARQRGLGFSGIPLGEQAKYTATEYMPALARLRQSGREQAMSLEDAILGIQERRGSLAQQLRQGDLDRDEQQRQFDQNMAFQREQANRAAAASRAASAKPSYRPTGGGGGGGGGGGQARVIQNGADFQFRNAGGAPITAAQYAQATGMDIRDVLYKMASAGDKTANQVYGLLRASQTPGGGKGVVAPFSQLQRQYAHILGGV